ncbi:two-component system, OmpR family, copper resistance phosphate regulon response regulator CusR [Mitsuaria sp. PDC51]|jgi:DNA-binding response OmpR family regulator|uniref:response regulator transcription factor n=1 Tax=unclassified Roseateles TaxID=2626991 RepID=UPI0008F13709|nr:MULTISPECIES: response regulator transcription factor [unclassified Roseateles]MBB3292076.1 DNA-binding response OmpR family regulator [Mitsuaria sp. BK041]MBB3361293.1 DNA-binding response OmpR family regulator [Mitsuaria sp. BK045]SFR73021.1 two-component system, OmpR family, copper resistance phosphate regulon response regulator CusR [Mitsuaria sp. PDC51]
MRILLVEDDRKAAGLLVRGLREEGFVVDHAASLAEADEAAFVTTHDLIVLDGMLPDGDGVTLCRTLRARGQQVPVLMLTARDALSDRVDGLNAGADDYLTKPFEFEELLARLRALLRRSDMTRPPVLVADDLRLDPASLQVTRAGRPVELTPKEFALLQALMRQPGAVVPRQRLAEQIWHGDPLAIDNLIDAHMSKLRRKIDAAGARPLIETVRGRGFRLRGPDDA